MLFATFGVDRDIRGQRGPTSRVLGGGPSALILASSAGWSLDTARAPPLAASAGSPHPGSIYVGAADPGLDVWVSPRVSDVRTGDVG